MNALSRLTHIPAMTYSVWRRKKRLAVPEKKKQKEQLVIASNTEKQEVIKKIQLVSDENRAVFLVSDINSYRINS